jgi:hypothetical protein
VNGKDLKMEKHELHTKIMKLKGQIAGLIQGFEKDTAKNVKEVAITRVFDKVISSDENAGYAWHDISVEISDVNSLAGIY